MERKKRTIKELISGDYCHDGDLTENQEKILTRKEIRALGGFKPGYPVARGEGMIRTADFERVAMNCFNAGVKLERTLCGYDYNHMGKMYRWTRQS